MIFNKKGDADLFDFLFIVFFSFLFYFFISGTLSASANSAEDSTLSLIKQREAEQLFMSYLSAPLDHEGNRVLDLISQRDYTNWRTKSNEFFQNKDICTKITVPPEEEILESIAKELGDNLPEKNRPKIFHYCPNTEDGKKMKNLLNSGKNPAGYRGNILEISFSYLYGEFEINAPINGEDKTIAFQYVIKK